MSIGVKYSLFFPLVFVKHAQEFSSRDLSLYKKKFSKRAKSFFQTNQNISIIYCRNQNVELCRNGEPTCYQEESSSQTVSQFINNQ